MVGCSVQPVLVRARSHAVVVVGEGIGMAEWVDREFETGADQIDALGRRLGAIDVEVGVNVVAPLLPCVERQPPVEMVGIRANRKEAALVVAGDQRPRCECRDSQPIG